MKYSPELIRKLAQKYHTPYYLFVEETIRARCAELKEAIKFPNTKIRYACKALTLQAILKIIKSEGLWIDASSLNEVKRAKLAGFNSDEIIYTGESANERVFRELFSLNVSINCSSLDQIRLIGKLWPGREISVRINPGEGHGANNKINTGGPASKHGIYFDQIDQIKSLQAEFNLKIVGIHTHIGSGTDLTHWLRIKDLTLNIAKQFSDLNFINLGGGLPVVYNPETDQPMPLKEWGNALTESFTSFTREYGKDLQLQIEPGRFVVAEAGFLVADIQNIKKTPDYNFLLVGTGFNHNPRSAMYGAFHPIEFVSSDGRELAGNEEYVVAGYLCESGDVFTKTESGEPAPRKFPKVRLGDLMVMGNIGAYSHAMKSEYNSMNSPLSLLLKVDRDVVVIERRGTLEDIMRREIEAY